MDERIGLFLTQRLPSAYSTGYTVLKGNSGISKNKDTPLEFCPKLWTEKFRHDDVNRGKCYQLVRSTTVISFSL